MHANPTVSIIISAYNRPQVIAFAIKSVLASDFEDWEPIVCTPEDAFCCFMGTDIEMLVVGNCLLRKEEQNAALRMNYSEAFELD